MTNTRGRPAGQKKTGGRTSGTPNKATASVKLAAQKFTGDALKTLATIANDGDAPAAARVSASVALLDRAHGKPSQAVEIVKDEFTPERASQFVAIMAKAHARQAEVRERRIKLGMFGD